jgi:hypothetical protein
MIILVSNDLGDAGELTARCSCATAASYRTGHRVAML